MPSVDSVTTVSGIFIFVGTASLLLRRPQVGAILYVIVGSAGVGLFWDRWSERAGNQDQISVLFAGPPPSAHELVLLATHGPLLLIGITALLITRLRRQ